MLYTLKCVRQKALVRCFKMFAFSKQFLNSIHEKIVCINNTTTFYLHGLKFRLKVGSGGNYGGLVGLGPPNQ